MERPAHCPRCSRDLTPPNVWSSDWECVEHGAVAPVRRAPEASADWMRHVSSVSDVPVWLPWPLGDAWVLSSVVPVGDDVGGYPAAATVLTGPHPLGGAAEMLLVAEKPGTGYAAHVAGLSGADPGDEVVAAAPYTHVEVDGHSAPLWLVSSDADQAVVVGERDMVWLWIVVRPAAAGVLLVDDLSLADARGLGDEVRLLPYGARSTWLDPD